MIALAARDVGADAGDDDNNDAAADHDGRRGSRCKENE